MSARAVLIIDDDFGFVVWLGCTLAESGYLTVPATSSKQAKGLIEKLRLTICLVIANLALPGLEDFVLVAQQQDPSVKVIAIRVSGTGSTPTVKVDGAHSRSQSDWLATVRHVLGNEKENGAG